jgi:hypothetical protein
LSSCPPVPTHMPLQPALRGLCVHEL